MRDLGEEVFPESKAEDAKAVATDGQTVEAVDPPMEGPKKSGDATEQEHAVTTEVRKPLKVPESVHVRITPENLKDYVGPPVYHRDRFYTVPPPPGVSTGLGYLGNGSGAVMPVEVIVSLPWQGL